MSKIMNSSHYMVVESGTFYKIKENIAGSYSESFKNFFSEWSQPSDKELGITGKEFDRYMKANFKKGIFSEEDIPVLEFLFYDEPGAMPPEACKRLSDVVEHFNRHIIYEYSERPDWDNYKGFIDILGECSENNVGLKWE